MVKRLSAQALIEKLKAERVRLVGELAGIDRALALIEEPPASADDGSHARGSAKTLLIDLLREVREAGLNATMAEEMASARGKKLRRSTAASNLSRMKADGIVIHDGDKYTLPEFLRPQPLLAVAGGKES